MSNMPKLPVDELCKGLNDSDARLVRAAFNGRTGQLRTSKPFKSDDCRVGKDDAEFKASANYVWRWLCFDYVAFRPHACMPVTDDFDLYFAYAGYTDRSRRNDAVKARVNELKEVVKRAESNLPVTLQANTMQLGRAFGII